MRVAIKSVSNIRRCRRTAPKYCGPYGLRGGGGSIVLDLSISLVFVDLFEIGRLSRLNYSFLLRNPAVC